MDGEVAAATEAMIPMQEPSAPPASQPAEVEERRLTLQQDRKVKMNTSLLQAMFFGADVVLHGTLVASMRRMEKKLINEITHQTGVLGFAAVQMNLFHGAAPNPMHPQFKAFITSSAIKEDAEIALAKVQAALEEATSPDVIKMLRPSHSILTTHEVMELQSYTTGKHSAAIKSILDKLQMSSAGEALQAHHAGMKRGAEDYPSDTLSGAASQMYGDDLS